MAEGDEHATIKIRRGGHLLRYNGWRLLDAKEKVATGPTVCRRLVSGPPRADEADVSKKAAARGSPMVDKGVLAHPSRSIGKQDAGRGAGAGRRRLATQLEQSYSCKSTTMLQPSLWARATKLKP